MTTTDTTTPPLVVTVPRTGPEVLAALRRVSLSEATLFRIEYRAALLEAAGTFDLLPARRVLLHWCGIAHLRMVPPTDAERDIQRRLRAGDPLDELPTIPTRRDTDG